MYPPTHVQETMLSTAATMIEITNLPEGEMGSCGDTSTTVVYNREQGHLWVLFEDDWDDDLNPTEWTLWVEGPAPEWMRSIPQGEEMSEFLYMLGHRVGDLPGWVLRDLTVDRLIYGA